MAMTTVETYDAIFNFLVPISFSLGDGGSLILSGLVSWLVRLVELVKTPGGNYY